MILWVCAAALLQFFGYEQGDHFAELNEGRSKLRVAAKEVVQSEAPGLDGTFEGVVMSEEPQKSPDAPVEPETPAPLDSAAPADPSKPLPQPKVEPPKPPPKKLEPPKPPPKPVEEKKKEEPDPKKTERSKVVVVPPQKRTAVQQQQDKDEEANPEAKFLAEKNHRVKHDMQATITSLSDDNKNPSPGTHQGPDSKEIGNGDKNVVRQDEDRKGENVAPNVIPKNASRDPVTGAPIDDKKPGTEKGDDKKPGADVKVASAATDKPRNASDGKGLGTKVPGAPEIMSGKDGNDVAPVGSAKVAVVAPASSAPPGVGDGKAKSLPALPALGGPKWTAGLGYGAKGDGGKPTITVNEKVLTAAVGMDELDKLRKKEGETRLSMHRGAWKSSDLSRWKPAIENYVPNVQPGNQNNLGTAASPFATYLAKIHNRLHPIFAEGFLDGLDDLGPTNALNDRNLVTKMEIVLRPDGTIHHLGIVKHSGVTAFDVAALDSVDRAAPFGNAPNVIVSPDGLVYLHWEFYRNDMRCATVNAYPYILKGPPATKEEPAPSGPKLPEGEKKFGVGPALAPKLARSAGS